MKFQPVFVIRRSNGSGDDCCNYSAHGEIGGVSDAIGYDKTAHARKFRTAEEAQEFICTKLPEWGRNCHCPAEVKPWDLSSYGTPLYAAILQQDIKIPDELLRPTPGRLLIWRK